MNTQKTLCMMLLPVLFLAFSARAQVTHVYATGIYPDDVVAVQTAVDKGGNVLLHGNFNFGTASWIPALQEAGGVVISKPGVMLMGLNQARISGGGKLFDTPDGWSILSPILISAPGVKVTCLEITGSPDAGILVNAPTAAATDKPIMLLCNSVGSGYAPIQEHTTSCPIFIQGNTLYPGSSDLYGISFGLQILDSPGMVNVINNKIIGVPSPFLFTMDIEFVPAAVNVVANKSEGCAYGIQTLACGTTDATGAVNVIGNCITECPIAGDAWYADIALFFNTGRTDVKGNVLRSIYDQPGAVPPSRHAGIWAFGWWFDQNGAPGQNPPVYLKDNVIETRFPLANANYQGMGMWLGGGGVGIDNVTVTGNKVSGVATAGIVKNEYGKNNLIKGNDLSGLKTWWAQVVVWAQQTTVSGNVFGSSNVTPGVSTAVELASNQEFAPPMPPPVTQCLLKMNDYRKTGLPGWSTGKSGCVHVFSYGDKGGVGTEVKYNTIQEGNFPPGTGIAQQVLVESSALVHDNQVGGLIASRAADEPGIEPAMALMMPSSPGAMPQKEQRLKEILAVKMARIGTIKAATQQPVIQDKPILTAAPTLLGNYPNPFNPSTTIRYALPQRTMVSLIVFNPLGQQVAMLVQGEKEAGYHEVRFDASSLASGVYIYRLQAGNMVETRKLLLVK